MLIRHNIAWYAAMNCVIYDRYEVVTVMQGYWFYRQHSAGPRVNLLQREKGVSIYRVEIY